MKRPLKNLFRVLIPAALLIGAAFFFTGSFFLSRVVLPVIGKKCGLEISASAVRWRPFTEWVSVENLRISAGTRPVFSVRQAAGRCHFRELRAGIIALSDVKLVEADWTLYRTAGTSEVKSRKGPEVFPPERKSASETARGEAASGAGKPDPPRRRGLRFNLRNIEAVGSRLQVVFHTPGGVSVLGLDSVNGSLDRFRNGAPLQLKLSGNFQLVSDRENNVDEGKFQLRADAVLGERLLPKELVLGCALSEIRGRISDIPLDGGALALHLESSGGPEGVTVRRLELKQLGEGAERSRVAFSGKIGRRPLRITGKFNGNLSEELLAVLFDLGFGIDPGRSTFACRGEFDWRPGWMSVGGTLHFSRSGSARFGRERIELPAFRIDSDQKLSIDWSEGKADLERCRVALTEGDRTAVLLELPEPVLYSWKDGEEAPPPGTLASFRLKFDRFELPLLRFLFRQDCPFRIDSGTFSGDFQLSLPRALDSLAVIGHGTVSTPAWRMGGYSVSLARLSAGVDAEVGRDGGFRLRSFSLEPWHASGSLGSAILSGTGNFRPFGAQFEGTLSRLRPELAIFFFPAMRALLPGWRALLLEQLSARFQIAFPAGKKRFEVRKWETKLERADGELLSVTAEPFSLRLPDWRPREDLRFRVKAAGEVELFNPFWRSTWFRFQEGTGVLNAVLTLPKSLSGISAEGKLTLNDLELALPQAERTVKNFSTIGIFSFQMPGFRRFELQKMDFYLRSAGRPALRLECPGAWDLDTGDYRGNWEVRYLNEEFVKMFRPDLAREVRFSGKAQVSGRDFFRSFRISAAGNLERWRFVTDTAPVSGNLSLSVNATPDLLQVGNLQLSLRQGEKPLLGVAGGMKLDRSSPSGAGSIQLEASAIDVGRLLALHPLPRNEEPETGAAVKPAAAIPETEAAESAAVEEPEQPATPPRLYFGSHPFDISLRADSIRYSPEIVLGLDGRLRIQTDRFHSDYLSLWINRSRFRLEFGGESRPEGIVFRVRAAGGEPLELRPLAELVMADEQNGLQGVLSETDLQLSWLEDGGGDAFLRSLDGRLGFKLRDLRIPHSLANGTVVRILLFPVELLAQLSRTAVEDLLQWKVQISSGDHLPSVLREIEFEEGSLEFTASHGQVRIGHCLFQGDWVSRLRFDGSFNLAGDRKLDLISHVTFGGVQAAFPIGGTINAPRVDLGAMASTSFLELFQKLRRLQWIGIEPEDPNVPAAEEPVIMIKEFNPGRSFRELREIFKDLWEK